MVDANSPGGGGERKCVGKTCARTRRKGKHALTNARNVSKCGGTCMQLHKAVPPLSRARRRNPANCARSENASDGM